MASGREWISISDLMSVLMIVFLFIAIVFMINVEQDNRILHTQHKEVTAIAKSYQDSMTDLQQQLQETFADDLSRWNAEVLPDGTFRFNDPKIQFALGSSEIQNSFKSVLSNFFPRYIAILTSAEWREEIEEISIVGHTSSDWQKQETDLERYLYNTKLSQARAFSVLDYVYRLPEIDIHRPWLQLVLRAKGASYANPVLTKEGLESFEKSRRVEFYARPRANDKILQILKKATTQFKK